MIRLSFVLLLATLLSVSCGPKQAPLAVDSAASQAFASDLETALAATLSAGPASTATMVKATETAAATPTAELGVGSSYVRPLDGKTMLFVPAGEFTMGLDDGLAGEGPAHTVYLDGYWIDRTEVTNGDYDKCVTAGACEKLAGDNPVDSPVVSVPWKGANAYCAWAQARLPTEAEWEKAARGTTGWIFPWGNDPAAAHFAPMGWDNKVEAVGSYPESASPYGVLDMAGSAFEWVSDWYSATYYVESPRSNPVGPDSGAQHVIRGGWWEWCPTYYRCQLNPNVRSTLRNGTGNYGRGGSGPAWIYYPWAGFRCAAPYTGQSGASVMVSTPGPTALPPLPGVTAHALLPPVAGSIPIEYGQKKGSMPRQGNQVYTFLGADGDIVMVRVQLSNAHSNLSFCNRGMTSSFTVHTDTERDIQPDGTGSNPRTDKIYELPYTGRYYIYVTCSGVGCNAYCAQLDVSVEKQ